jgi:choline-glycine betaine transporter
MKTNGIPAIVMLLAGFVDCLIAIRTHMTLGNFTRQLFLVLLIFYVIGCTVKLILDRNMKAMEEVKTVKEELGEKEKEEKEGDESQEEATEDDTEKEKQAEENE